MRGAWGLALVLGLGACAGGDTLRTPRQPLSSLEPAVAAARQEREAEMNRQWQNKPVADLLVAYGRPRLVMKIPGGGNPPAYAVVYGLDPASGCIDAFAIHSTGDPVIRIYYCR